MNKDLHIVYASDNSFAEILGVSLTSLYENNKDMEQIHVYVLDSRISEENKDKINAVSAAYGRCAVTWIPAKDISKELSIDVATDRGSLSQYARLFVSSVLPADLDKVLYLDCDIVIRQSLSELWNLDMHGKTIAALMDSFSKLYRANIDLNPTDIMFNSGVMLIDLNLWKKKEIEKQLLRFIQLKGGKIQQGDQGALNAVLSHDVYCFEPRFNSVTIFYDFTYQEMLVYRKPPEFYSEQEVKDAADNPVIVHFTTSILSRRPWIEGCRHRYVDEWLKYKSMSPWRDAPLWEYQKPTGIKGIGVRFTDMLPRKLMIALIGVAQAYGRPIMNRIVK